MASDFTMPSGLYTEIEQFYAVQIQLLSGGAVDQWTETFAPNAVFEQDGRLLPDGAREPRARWRGRAEIAAAAASAGRNRQVSAVVRRYWVGMVDVDVVGADSVRTSYYGALFNVAPEEGADVFRSTSGTDLLVRDGNDWRVAHRRIDHDDVGEAQRR